MTGSPSQPICPHYTCRGAAWCATALALMTLAAGCFSPRTHQKLNQPVQHPSDHQETFPLWQGSAPESKGEATKDVPTITVYLPPANIATGTAVVVNPGGGYWVLAADHEGVQAARWLNREGIAAFVLRYRVQPDYDPEVALADGKRAMRWVRAHAAKYRISQARIGMMGFSAGGNLAASVGTDPEPGATAGSPGFDDEVERQATRPDFLLLVYPAISHQVGERQTLGRSVDTLVTETTPPTFLVHTHEDTLTPLHSVRFYEQLLELKIPAELHIFAFGPHGTGLAPGDPDLARWPDLAVRWMRRNGFLADGARLAISGSVHVNGRPLSHGWLTLEPQNPRLPVVAAYLRKKDGAFEIAASHGPYPGRYRVTAHVLSTPDSDMKIGKTSLDDAVAATTPENPKQGEDALWVQIPAGSTTPLQLRLKSASGQLP